MKTEYDNKALGIFLLQQEIIPEYIYESSKLDQLAGFRMLYLINMHSILVDKNQRCLSTDL
ncbi:MAG: hypothetical protein K0U86_17820 [Planctomycetes bacterium]|nr:hypothetical protein [Planctomycetota bacterium]MCH9726765.1 hypothetical protein [Planctomycetota bacterium]MCH9776790.1 hypothetical protein [Planctomycetota bacterium]MCH9792346.1 hypothetical protein [Planctomycetota bacterium]